MQYCVFPPISLQNCVSHFRRSDDGPQSRLRYGIQVGTAQKLVLHPMEALRLRVADQVPMCPGRAHCDWQPIYILNPLCRNEFSVNFAPSPTLVPKFASRQAEGEIPYADL